MALQADTEKRKYRNWVRGGLALKYLKQGIEGFADDVVKEEHKRILQNIKNTPGQTCNQCSVRSLKPKHANTVTCQWGLNKNCNCVNKKKNPCMNNLCDVIMGEILDSHDPNCLKPPMPNWKNTDIHKWGTDPWEIAKCFIQAPGYFNKSNASDIDAAGLLHVFINNINLHSHLSCIISGTDILSKTRKRRNEIFHSATMELEDNKLNECIDDIIAILEDKNELKQRPDAQQAVEKLNQLKLGSFIITINNEVEVCRDAMVSITNRSAELKQMIQDAKEDIDQKMTEVSEAVDDKTRESLEDALKQLEKQNDSQLQTMKQTIQLLTDRLQRVEADNSVMKQDISLIQQRLTQIESSVEELDTTRSAHNKQLEYVKQKQALQSSLVERYEKGYFKTWISPLKTQHNDIDVNEIYVTPNMVVEKKTDGTASTGSLSGPETAKRLSERSSAGNRRPSPDEQNDKSQLETVSQYEDIFQTDNARHKKIYIIGDVGTGKSTLSKMMIYNWCRAVRGDNENAANTTDTYNESKGAGRDKTQADKIQADNKREMSKFDFLFTIPLQRMSGFSSDVKEMIKALYKDVITEELLTKIFNQESERCLIIADGLDEWTPPKHAPSPQHVSHSIPVADGIKNATFVTLSRPSARGILNMKLSECDKKITLLGVHEKSLYTFINKYMVKLNQNVDSYSFLEKIKEANLEHLEKTPLILQQLIWMFCTGYDIGKSIADIYSNIVNIMFGWYENKKEDTTPSSVNTNREFEQMQLPELLRRFPPCERNERILFLLGKQAFKAVTADAMYTFGRSVLYHELSGDDIRKLISSGILVEYNCFDPTIENTQLSFIHTSYLEFFAAVYISSHYCNSEQHPTHEQVPKKPQLENRTVLKELFMKYKSAEDILQLSNLLKMVCGLSPFLLEEMSSLISKNMMSDESMIKYRNDLSLLSRYVTYELNVAEQIQSLIFDCFEECGTVNPPAVSLCDVIPKSIYYFFLRQSCWKSFCQNIVSSSVLSINLRSLRSGTETIKWIGELHQLQFIRIEKIKTCKACEQLSLSLKETELMKTLKLEAITCDNNTCKGHTIDLSGHNQLQSIHLKYCSVMLGSLVNTKSLENVSISKRNGSKTPHVMCEHLSSSLSQAVSLKELTLEDIVCDRDNCDGHTIDLSGHSQLQSIHLKDCSVMLGSLVNTKSLENVSISKDLGSKTPHVMCEHLSSSLSQAVSLKQLTLKISVCDRDNCEGHTIDLSKHDQLQSVNLRYFSISSINTKNLQTLTVSQSDIHQLLQSCYNSKLERLSISDSRLTYTSEMNYAVQSLQHLQTLELNWRDIDENALTVTAGMMSLKYIILWYASISLQTWCTFVDSLLQLQHSVKVETWGLSIGQGRKDAALQYVRQNQALLVVHQESSSYFIFSSKKWNLQIDPAGLTDTLTTTAATCIKDEQVPRFTEAKITTEEKNPQPAEVTKSKEITEKKSENVLKQKPEVHVEMDREMMKESQNLKQEDIIVKGSSFSHLEEILKNTRPIGEEIILHFGGPSSKRLDTLTSDILDMLTDHACKLHDTGKSQTISLRNISFGQKTTERTFSTDELASMKSSLSERYSPRLGCLQLLAQNLETLDLNKNDFSAETNEFAKLIILDFLCYSLATEYENIMEAYPSATDDSIILIALTREYSPITNIESFRGFKVVCKALFSNSSESISAENYAQEKGLHCLSSPNFRILNEVIESHTDTLFDTHSNLEGIGSSMVRSTRNGYCTEESPCVVLYCRCKSYIPYGEEHFPTTLSHVNGISFKTDVREGYFQLSPNINNLTGTAEEWHKELVMGCSIGPKSERLSGTLGPFLSVEGIDETCFMTVRHMFQPFNGNDTLPTNTKLMQPADCDQKQNPDSHVSQGNQKEEDERPDPYSHVSQADQENIRECGEVVISTFNEFVDAAVVKIKADRSPSRGLFVLTKNELDFAGFSFSNFPTFDDGSTIDAKSITISDFATERVIKFGKTTGLTKGTLQLNAMAVKIMDERGTQNNGLNRLMKHQLKINSHLNAFCQPGDSGSAVFLVDKENKLFCIGMVIGSMSDHSCVVTPIETILSQLEQKLRKKITVKKFEFEPMQQ